jgi:hypothetical protein
MLMTPTTPSPRPIKRLVKGVAVLGVIASASVLATAGASASTGLAGHLDPLTVSADKTTWTLTGWAIDYKTPTSPIQVHTYLDGTLVTGATADQASSELSSTTTAGNAHGFDVTITAPTTAGTHYACEYAINSNGTGPNPLIGCRKITM